MADDWFEGGGSGSPVDVAALLDGTGVTESIAALVVCGALVSIGTTSDGGALGVTVTLDERRRREYFRDPEALTEWLLPAVEAVALAAKSRPAFDARPSRRRRS